MSVQQPVETAEEANENEFTAHEANNFVRGNTAGCLVLTTINKGEPVKSVFISVKGETYQPFFELTEFGTPSKVKKFRMSAALENARKSGGTAELKAYGQTDFDIENAIEFILETFEIDAKETRAKFGLSRDVLDEDDEGHLENAASTTDDRAGGW